MKKKLCLLFLILFLFAIIIPNKNSPVTAFADLLLPETSYKIELENGRKFFYMRGSQSDEDFLDLESGLYYTDTLENIYLIEPFFYNGNPYTRYMYEGSCIISEDGRYFAHMPWTRRDNEWFRCGDEWVLISAGKGGLAIEFFEDGKLLKQYFLSDLVKDLSQMSFSASHVRWEDYEKRDFNSSLNELSITTLDGIDYLFDITTGEPIYNNKAIVKVIDELISKNKELAEKLDEYGKKINQNTIILYILVATVAVLSISVFFIIFKTSKKNHKTDDENK